MSRFNEDIISNRQLRRRMDGHFALGFTHRNLRDYNIAVAAAGRIPAAFAVNNW